MSPERGAARPNKTMEKLAAGQVALGIVSFSHSPETVEMLGALGFDYVTFDCEHEPFDELSLLHMVRAAESFGITPIARVPNDPNLILRCLDAGVQGVHVPRINTKGEAQGVVEACRFYPLGRRTFFALGRSANYGIGIEEQTFSQEANRQLLVICQVEEVEGIKNLADILSVPSVDFIQFGAKDLWQSMGMPAQEVVQQTIDQAIRETVAAGKGVSLQMRLTPDIEERVAGNVEKGVRMFSVTSRDFLRRGAEGFLRGVSQRLSGAAGS